MPEYTVEVYFPLFQDFIFKHHSLELTDLVLNEIEEVLKGIDFTTKEFIVSTNIKGYIIPELAEEVLAAIFESYIFPKVRVVHFSIQVKVDLSKYEINFHKDDNITRLTDESEILNEHLPYYLAILFQYRIFEVIALSQLARPASLKLGKGVIWINKRKWAEIKVYQLSEAYEYYVKKGYPKIDLINFPKFYSWLKLNDLIFTKSPINSYAKAINNFSHLTSDINDINKLVYQMMTLEQLYTNSIHQIAEQLNTKIQLYLGEIVSYKSQIKSMYNIRSRFLHGDLPSVASHKAHQFEDYPGIQQELIDAENLSLLLIVSTLQKMFKDDLLDLKFEYSLAK